jgi:DNA-binding NtrC family response regulator
MIRLSVSDFLQLKGYAVDEAASLAAAEHAFRALRADLVVADYRLPDGNAIELIPRIRAIDAAVPIVILTGHGSIELAVAALKKGANHFLTKPIELPALLVVIERLLEDQRNRKKQLARKLGEQSQVDPFIGTSAAIRQLQELATTVAGTDSSVMILGETGTGKGVLARWIHGRSERAEEAFVNLNCAGLARDFLESELFGHEKGAFTGAVNSKQGLLEVAHRGTVFLDEIGDVDPQVQPKLLKVVEEKTFRRLGDVRDRRVDIRLIAATHQNLVDLVRERRFRSDLYFRLSVVPLNIPPLRERREDIPLLARKFLADFAVDLGKKNATLTPDAEQALVAYMWPGNIRELRNVLERAVLLNGDRPISRSALNFDASRSISSSSAGDVDLTLEEVERRHIRSVLEAEQGNVERAAARLAISRSSLYQKIKAYQLTSKV